MGGGVSAARAPRKGPGPLRELAAAARSRAHDLAVRGSDHAAVGQPDQDLLARRVTVPAALGAVLEADDGDLHVLLVEDARHVRCAAADVAVGSGDGGVVEVRLSKPQPPTAAVAPGRAAAANLTSVPSGSALPGSAQNSVPIPASARPATWSWTSAGEPATVVRPARKSARPSSSTSWALPPPGTVCWVTS